MVWRERLASTVTLEVTEKTWSVERIFTQQSPRTCVLCTWYNRCRPVALSAQHVDCLVLQDRTQPLTLFMEAQKTKFCQSCRRTTPPGSLLALLSFFEKPIFKGILLARKSSDASSVRWFKHDDADIMFLRIVSFFRGFVQTCFIEDHSRTTPVCSCTACVLNMNFSEGDWASRRHELISKQTFAVFCSPSGSC